MRVVLGYALILAVMAAPVAAQTVQAYKDPGGLFTISYPTGWKVLRHNGVTAFLPGDPDVSFSVFPTIQIDGRLSAAQFLQAHLADERAKYPDLKIISQKAQAAPRGGGPSSIEAVWTWTNARKVPVRAWITLAALPVPGANRTAIGFVQYQTPSNDWQRFEPVFKRMLQSIVWMQPK